MRIDKGKLFAMTQSLAYQRLKLSAGLELIEPAQGPEDLLAHLLTFADAMDDLEILVGTGTFDSEKHCSLSQRCNQKPRILFLSNTKQLSFVLLALHFEVGN